jgi:hypothetical protein
MAQEVGAVWSDFDFKDGVVGHELADRLSGLPVAGKDHESTVIGTQSEFDRRTEHALGLHSAHLGFTNREAFAEFCAGEGAGNLVSDFVIFGAANDLSQFAFAGIHLGDAQAIGIRVWIGLFHLGDHHGVGRDPHFFDAFHFHSCEGEDVIKFGVAQAGEVEMVGKPVFGD